MTMLYVNFDPDRDKMGQLTDPFYHDRLATYCKVCYVASGEISSLNDSLTSKKEASSS